MDRHDNDSDSSDDSGASYHSIEHPPSFNRDGNRPEGKRSHHDATLMNSGPPRLYRLNTDRKYVDGTNKKVRRWTYGRKDKSKPNKVILLVGETGAGKTTFTNTMVNYLLGVKFEDEEFYQITEVEKREDQTQFQTSEITVYEMFVEENPKSLTIIDTPGYGNTEENEKDEEIAKNLSKLFSEEDGVHFIDAVCFVMKASQNRLSGKELYIFHSVLSLFGRDIENNIVCIITHSDGGPPTDALNAINKAEIPCKKKSKKQPVHFLFNNRQKEKREKQYDHVYRTAWEMGDKSMNGLLTLLKEKNRKGVRNTLGVLKDRRELEVCVSHLKQRTTDKELKIKDLTQIQETIRQNRDKIEKYQNFEFTVEKNVKEKVLIENASWRNRLATCCSICQETCHENCWWVNDLSWCEAMKNYYCTVCTGKCHYSKHVRDNKKYVLNIKTIKMKLEEIKQEFEHNSDKNVRIIDKTEYENIKKELENTMKESENQEKEEEKLISELEKIKNEMSNLLHEAYISIVKLSEIALKADSAFTLRHLDFLLLRLKEEGKDEWMKKLEDLRKTGEEQKNKGALRCMQELTGQNMN